MSSNYLTKDSTYYQTYFIDIKANPFVKWAGGKRQLIDEIHNYLPKMIETEKGITYIEPFVGGGAVFFSLSSFPSIGTAYLIDNNLPLIITYNVIKNDLDQLIIKLDGFEQSYHNKNQEERSKIYYRTRDEFNKLKKSINSESRSNDWLDLAARFIFLNRTCFNGLYRVNSKGEFNVPIGSYTNPKICDAKNLYHVHKSFKNATIINDDFQRAEELFDEKTFIYLDPPYRPLKPSSFTSYTKDEFDEGEQFRLAEFCRKADRLGAKFLLSNSDPKNTDPDDDFFDELYKGFNIIRIDARRNINSNGNDRGHVSELLICNY